MIVLSAGTCSITAAAKSQFTHSFVLKSKGKIVILHGRYVYFVLKRLNLNLHVHINVYN